MVDTIDVRRGVRGEASYAGGSPRSYTARIDLWHRGPSRAPVPHEARAPLCGGLWLNDGNAIRRQGIRVSRCIAADYPIKMQAFRACCKRGALKAPLYMRSDYVVVTPNGAHVAPAYA